MDTKSLMADLTLLSLPGFRLNYMTDKKNNLTAIAWKHKKILFYLFVNLLLYFYDFDFTILFETTKKQSMQYWLQKPFGAKISFQNFFIVLICWHYERQHIA